MGHDTQDVSERFPEETPDANGRYCTLAQWRLNRLYGGRQGGFPKTHEAEAIQEVNAQTCCLRV